MWDLRLSDTNTNTKVTKQRFLDMIKQYTGVGTEKYLLLHLYAVKSLILFFLFQQHRFLKYCNHNITKDKADIDIKYRGDWERE